MKNSVLRAPAYVNDGCVYVGVLFSPNLPRLLNAYLSIERRRHLRAADKYYSSLRST